MKRIIGIANVDYLASITLRANSNHINNSK